MCIGFSDRLPDPPGALQLNDITVNCFAFDICTSFPPTLPRSRTPGQLEATLPPLQGVCALHTSPRLSLIPQLYCSCGSPSEPQCAFLFKHKADRGGLDFTYLFFFAVYISSAFNIHILSSTKKNDNPQTLVESTRGVS